MVTIKKDHRYYGRSATVNIRLTEGEVARLYAQRQLWEREQKSLLDGIVKKVGIEPHDDYGYLYLTARPLISDEELFDRAKGDQDDKFFLRDLVQRAKSPSVFYSEAFFQERNWKLLSDGWKGYLYHAPYGYGTDRTPDSIIDTEISFNGQAYLFSGRIALKRKEGMIISEKNIAEITTRFLFLIGNLYTKSGYSGPVDIGVLMTGIKGGISRTLYSVVNSGFANISTVPKFERSEYSKIIRRPSSDLKDKPKEVAESLTIRFIRAITQDQYNPFK